MREKSMGHDTKWSAVSDCDKHPNQPRENLICIQINSLIVSDAPIRFAQFVSGNQIIRHEAFIYH